MNNFSQDVYFQQGISSAEIVKILKFHQSNICVLDPKEEHPAKTEWINTNSKTILKSDTHIHEVFLSEIVAPIVYIYTALKEEFYGFPVVTTLPVLTITTDDYCNLTQGSYTFDFEKMCLHKYKDNVHDDLKDIFYNKNVSMSLSLFLDIEKSVFIHGNMAYINGIMQVGMLTKAINDCCKENSIPMTQAFINTQKFTNLIGINLRKQLLINNICFGGEL